MIATIGRISALPARCATSAIPIVFVGVGDPVGTGLVASLARWGGNLTGFSNIFIELMPQARVVALIANPNAARAEVQIRVAQEAARATGVQLPVLKAGTEGEIDAAIASLRRAARRRLSSAPIPYSSARASS